MKTAVAIAVVATLLVVWIRACSKLDREHVTDVREEMGDEEEQ